MSCMRHQVAKYFNSLGPSGLLPDDTKPLPEPMLTDHQRSPVTFILGQFHKRCHNHQSLKSVWKLLMSNFIQISQGPMSYPSGVLVVKSGIFRGTRPVAVDALASSVIRSSAAMLLNMQAEWVFVIYREDFLMTYAVAVLRNYRKCKYMFMFSKISSSGLNQAIRGSFWVWARPMRDDVTM